MTTHKFNGVDQLNGTTNHPLAGVECEIVERSGMSKAGYDTTVRVPTAEWLAGYKKTDPDFDWEDFIIFQDLACPDGGDFVICEANYDDELTAI